MDKQEGLRQAGLALSSDKEITTTLPIRELWLVVSALQLMVTHPGLHEPLKTISEQIGRKLGTQIVEALPEVEELLTKGWQREYDVEQDDDEAPYGWYGDDDYPPENDDGVPW